MTSFLFSQEYWAQRRIIATVRHALTSADQSARINAVYALTAAHDYPGVSRALRHKDQSVRIEATKGMAQLGGWKALWRLVRLLNDKDRKVAHVAAERLAHITGRGVGWALGCCARSEDGIVRYFGAVGLERLLFNTKAKQRVLQKAVARLEAMQNDEEQLVRNSARQTLQRRRT
jgi:HEAT repeat protein